MIVLITGAFNVNKRIIKSFAPNEAIICKIINWLLAENMNYD